MQNKMIKFILEFSNENPRKQLDEFFIIKPSFQLHFVNEYSELIAWGDPISTAVFNDKDLEELTPEFIVKNLYGHYYFLLRNNVSGNLFIGNSMFSILPIYYCVADKRIIFSDNAIDLGKYSLRNIICKRFLLETILFNYPLFNLSIIKEILLLPSNSYIFVNNTKPVITKHTNIEDYFVNNPVPWKKSILSMTETFLETTEKYLPDDSYVNTLTGGFDGRTLVSAGLYFKKNFTTMCFGAKNTIDVKLAEKLSATAGIQHEHISLGEEYICKKSLECGQEFIINSSGSATFARAHYLHAAKTLASGEKIMITGNFGSELFRAAHIAGAMISGNLVNLFESRSPTQAFNSVENSDEFRWIKKTNLVDEWESFKSDLSETSWFNHFDKDLTRNQKFYICILEEVFRKYFGAEMVNQFIYLRNRTPFLDFDFIKALFKTEMSGIHSDLFEHNPLKRIKGQFLYASIIDKAYPKFSSVVTGKGYRPEDLFTLIGKFNIAQSYLSKIINGKNHLQTDPNSVELAWSRNQMYWKDNSCPPKFFSNALNKDVSHDLLFKILSLCFVINKKY